LHSVRKKSREARKKISQIFGEKLEKISFLEQQISQKSRVVDYPGKRLTNWTKAPEIVQISIHSPNGPNRNEYQLCATQQRSCEQDKRR